MNVHVNARGTRVRCEPGDRTDVRLSRLRAWTLEAVEPADSPPPRTGRGSGRKAWAAYAATIGVDVDGTASRDDIVNAVDAHL